jgi:DNA-binding NarL/FixJ family response regulator
MAEPSPSTKGAPSVLIVDDHELVGTSLAVALTAEGLRARRAAAVDLVGVLKEAASLPPGLALLDLDLGRDRQGRRRD